MPAIFTEPATRSVPTGTARQDAELNTVSGVSQQLSTPPPSTTQKLTAAEMMTVSTINDLRDLYEQRGKRFESEAKFLETVRSDWMDSAQTLARTVSDAPLKAPIDMDRVTLGDQRFAILGVWHTGFAGKDSVRAIERTLGTGEGWLHEENLQNMYRTRQSKAVNDHAVPHTLGAGNLITRMMSGFALTFGALGVLLPGPYFNELLKSHPTLDAEGDSDQVWDHSTSLSNGIRKAQRIPSYVQATGEMPPYVVLELKERQGIPLNDCQARSAYMAEVLRRWNHEGEKKILVGQAHASEVAYFLRHPCTDQRIVDLAERHATKLNAPEASPDTLNGFWSYGWQAFVGYAAGLATFGYVGTVLVSSILRWIN